MIQVSWQSCSCSAFFEAFIVSVIDDIVVLAFNVTNIHIQYGSFV